MSSTQAVRDRRKFAGMRDEFRGERSRVNPCVSEIPVHSMKVCSDEEQMDGQRVWLLFISGTSCGDAVETKQRPKYKVIEQEGAKYRVIYGALAMRSVA